MEKRDIMGLTAVELGRKIKAGELTATQAVEASLEAISAREEAVKSFLAVDAGGLAVRIAD